MENSMNLNEQIMSTSWKDRSMISLIIVLIENLASDLSNDEIELLEIALTDTIQKLYNIRKANDLKGAKND